jgi:hypothetical protein
MVVCAVRKNYLFSLKNFFFSGRFAGWAGVSLVTNRPDRRRLPAYEIG